MLGVENGGIHRSFGGVFVVAGKSEGFVGLPGVWVYI